MNKPVAWIDDKGDLIPKEDLQWFKDEGYTHIPLYTYPHPDNLGLAESIIKQQQLKIDNLLENNARLDAEIEVLKADNDKLTEALLKANRVYDFDNPLLDKELEK